jgi:hypothetical protein
MNNSFIRPTSKEVVEQSGIIHFSKLICKIAGFAINNETLSEEEAPLYRKKNET